MYDKNNVFAKILNNQISCEKLHEDEFVIAINDINPVAPVHILIIPKGECIDFEDFIANGTSQEILHYFQTVTQVAKKYSKGYYRIITNKGAQAGQSVFHFHTHIVGGLQNLDLVAE